MPQDLPFLSGLARLRLSGEVDVASFECNPEVDWFLREAACEYQDGLITAVMCWLRDGTPLGYVSTHVETVKIDSSPQRSGLGLSRFLKRKDGQIRENFPALKIGMLGVSKSCRRRGLAKHMIQFVIGQARSLSKEVGCRFVTVDSDQTEEARGLYGSVGFKKVDRKQDNRETDLLYFDLASLRRAEVPTVER